MAHRRDILVLDQYQPNEITFDGWEECERRGDIVHPGRNVETDETHEDSEDEA